MLKLSKRWMFVVAIGQGVLFSMALTGLVRFGYWLSDTPMSQVAADRLFVTSSLLTGALAATLYGIMLRRADAKSSG
ncbi:hypothetical protein LOC69_09815 [Blastopirellula sp. JC733]|nr:hypothetical protein [Blastopirellula sediminis]